MRNALHRFWHLNNLSSVGGDVWRGLEEVALKKKYGFERLRHGPAITILSALYLLTFSILLWQPSLLPAVMFP